MDKKYMKKHSTPLIIPENLNKMRYLLEGLLPEKAKLHTTRVKENIEKETLVDQWKI